MFSCDCDNVTGCISTVVFLSLVTFSLFASTSVLHVAEAALVWACAAKR